MELPSKVSQALFLDHDQAADPVYAELDLRRPVDSAQERQLVSRGRPSSMYAVIDSAATKRFALAQREMDSVHQGMDRMVRLAFVAPSGCCAADVSDLWRWLTPGL